MNVKAAKCIPDHKLQAALWQYHVSFTLCFSAFWNVAYLLYVKTNQYLKYIMHLIHLINTAASIKKIITHTYWCNIAQLHHKWQSVYNWTPATENGQLFINTLLVHS